MQKFLDYFPVFDGQTVITFVAGTLLTLFLFFVQSRREIGARREKLRSANNDLISSVQRRIAVERQRMNVDQYDQIKTAKAYFSELSEIQLLSFETALSIVTSRIIDNDFLDQPSKNSIVELLSESRATNIQNDNDPRRRPTLEVVTVEQTGWLPISAAIASLLVGFVSSFVVEKSKFFDTSLNEIFPSLVALVVTAFAAISSLSFLKDWKVKRRKGDDDRGAQT